MLNKTILRTFGLGINLVLLLALTQCAVKTAPVLPKDILGISVGMDKSQAQIRLKEIGKLLREDRKQQEVWVLKEGARFGHLALGYDKENRVQYVTAIAKPNGEIPMKPDEIGVLTDAKQDLNGPNYTYTWQVAAAENRPAYTISAQGNQPESLSLFTMSVPREEPFSEEKKGEK